MTLFFWLSIILIMVLSIALIILFYFLKMVDTRAFITTIIFIMIPFIFTLYLFYSNYNEVVLTNANKELFYNDYYANNNFDDLNSNVQQFLAQNNNH